MNKEINSTQSAKRIYKMRLAAATDLSSVFTVGNKQISSNKNIDMGNQKVTGLPDPLQDGEAVNLGYLNSNYISVNDENSGYLKLSGGDMSGKIDMGGRSVTQLSTPIEGNSKTLDPTQAVTVEYVDKASTGAINKENITTALNKVKGITDQLEVLELAVGIQHPDNNQDNTDTSTQENTAKFVLKIGDTMSGALSMGYKKITHVKNPNVADITQAATVNFVKSQSSLPTLGMLGNTMSGNITLNSGMFPWMQSSFPASKKTSPKTLTDAIENEDSKEIDELSSVPRGSADGSVGPGTDNGTSGGTNGSNSNTTVQDNIKKTDAADKCFKINGNGEKTKLKVLFPGLVILMATFCKTEAQTTPAPALENDSENTNNIPEIEFLAGSNTGRRQERPDPDFEIDVIVSEPTTIPAHSKQTNPSENTMFKLYGVYSGQSVVCQIPIIKANSEIQLTFNKAKLENNVTYPTNMNTPIASLSFATWNITLLPTSDIKTLKGQNNEQPKDISIKPQTT
ncbi:hypothetical protein CP10139811_0031 [Chlamydia ibidis]|uniref:Uncharacterized protein n=2 Tax=Chlamydia ibidis TaxID=1405396 RepID=S7KHS4_9CHLA|nr:hypothetical protein [Chlamydia ibidis]EPP35701.1 hypothetical protein CP10139811_0031 [Chlamydia ibidis]EQM62791.1 hypothetical protein H359_0476 [Chlamydia ibidis 10-1398/6]